jgi:hypothetical protein
MDGELAFVQRCLRVLQDDAKVGFVQVREETVMCGLLAGRGHSTLAEAPETITS